MTDTYPIRAIKPGRVPRVLRRDRAGLQQQLARRAGAAATSCDRSSSTARGRVRRGSDRRDLDRALQLPAAGARRHCRRRRGQPRRRAAGVPAARDHVRLMRRLLADIRDRGESLAALFASEAGIYGRFGYGSAAERAAPHDPARRGRADRPGPPAPAPRSGCGPPSRGTPRPSWPRSTTAVLPGGPA